MAENQKKPESGDMKRDSFVYRLCLSVGRWFLVSLFFYLCSIPIFTIGTAWCAVIAVIRENHDDLRYIFGSFFSFFGAYFKKTAPIFLIFLFFLLLQFLNLSFYSQFIDSYNWVSYALIGIVLFLILTAVAFLRFYDFEVSLGEPAGIPMLARCALHRMLRCLPVAGVLALLDIVIVATLAGVPSAVPILLIYPGFQAFLMCILVIWFEHLNKPQK